VIQIIAALSVVGIAIGAGTLLSVLSIFKGFHHAAQTLLLRYDPHIRLVPVQGQWMVAPPETLKAYARLSGAQAVMPVVSLRLMARHGEALSPAFLVAAPEAELRRATAIPEAMVLGEFRFQSAGLPSVVVGAGLAQRLHVLPGDTLLVWTPNMLEQLALGLPFQPGIAVVVAGIFQSPAGEQQSLSIYADTGVGRLLAGFPPHGWSSVDIWLPRSEEVPHALRFFQEQGGKTFRPLPWYELHRQLYDVLRLERLGTFIVLSLIVLVAVFNVAASLRMSAVRKQREIAIVRALGMQAMDIQRLYVRQGFILGGLGILVGVLAGIGFYWGQQRFGWIRLDPTRYILSSLPVRLELWDVLTVTVVGFALVLTAAIVPARWAARQRIAEALREE